MDNWRVLGNFLAAFSTAFVATNYYATPESFQISLLNGFIAGCVAALLEYKKLSDIVVPIIKTPKRVVML